jgi:uncharacterized protein YbjT (DUF2867 family)
VISHLQRDGTFAVRALTRRPSSPPAKGQLLHHDTKAQLILPSELSRSGVEVVYADYDNLESLVDAFRGRSACDPPSADYALTPFH